MSRYATHGGGSAVAAQSLLNIASKGQQYKEPIKVNHALTKTAAQRIMELEHELHKLVDESIMPKEDLEKVLNEHKESLKEIAVKNVERERNVDSFVSGVNVVRNELMTNQNNDNDQENTTTLPDYTKKIKDAMVQHKNSVQHAEVKQEGMYREIAELLGEKAAGADEDFEIIETHQGGGASLKCPVTGRLIEDPVKNTVCGHVYSREGIMSHIRAKGQHARCPVTGCGHGPVTLAQLEKDVETELAVNREKRRQDHEYQQRASQASDLMDSDEE